MPLLLFLLVGVLALFADAQSTKPAVPGLQEPQNVDQSGEITAQDWYTIFSLYVHAFGTWDTNHDGLLTFSEFAMLYQEYFGDKDQPSVLEPIDNFVWLDSDGDRKLNFREFSSLDRPAHDSRLATVGSEPLTPLNAAAVVTAMQTSRLRIGAYKWAWQGFVYSDTNANGVFNSGEPGLAGVTMLLFRSSAPNGGGQLAFQKAAVTNNDGVWFFTSFDVIDSGPIMKIDNGAETLYAGGLDGTTTNTALTAFSCTATFACEPYFVVLMQETDPATPFSTTSKYSTISGVPACPAEGCPVPRYYSQSSPVASTTAGVYDNWGGLTNAAGAVIVMAENAFPDGFDGVNTGTDGARRTQFWFGAGGSACGSSSNPSLTGAFDVSFLTNGYANRVTVARPPGFILSTNPYLLDRPFCTGLIPHNFIAGYAFRDSDGNKKLDNGEVPLVGYKVEIQAPCTGTAVTVTSNSKGYYSYGPIAPIKNGNTFSWTNAVCVWTDFTKETSVVASEQTQPSPAPKASGENPITFTSAGQVAAAPGMGADVAAVNALLAPGFNVSCFGVAPNSGTQVSPCPQPMVQPSPDNLAFAFVPSSPSSSSSPSASRSVGSSASASGSCSPGAATCTNIPPDSSASRSPGSGGKGDNYGYGGNNGYSNNGYSNNGYNNPYAYNNGYNNNNYGSNTWRNNNPSNNGYNQNYGSNNNGYNNHGSSNNGYNTNYGSNNNGYNNHGSSNNGYNTNYGSNNWGYNQNYGSNNNGYNNHGSSNNGYNTNYGSNNNGYNNHGSSNNGYNTNYGSNNWGYNQNYGSNNNGYNNHGSSNNGYNTKYGSNNPNQNYNGYSSGNSWPTNNGPAYGANSGGSWMFDDSASDSVSSGLGSCSDSDIRFCRQKYGKKYSCCHCCMNGQRDDWCYDQETHRCFDHPTDDTCNVLCKKQSYEERGERPCAPKDKTCHVGTCVPECTYGERFCDVADDVNVNTCVPNAEYCAEGCTAALCTPPTIPPTTPPGAMFWRQQQAQMGFATVPNGAFIDASAGGIVSCTSQCTAQCPGGMACCPHSQTLATAPVNGCYNPTGEHVCVSPLTNPGICVLCPNTNPVACVQGAAIGCFPSGYVCRFG